MMKYLPGYLFLCWAQIIMTILESVAGEFPYRFDWTEGADRVRPGYYAEYHEFRELQE